MRVMTQKRHQPELEARETGETEALSPTLAAVPCDTVLVEPRTTPVHLLPNQRAMQSFAQRIALTGVSIREGEKLVFAGWDRLSQRPVRVVIEEEE